MDYYKIMNMHAPIYHEFNPKLINSNMHAWITLYNNMYAPKHGLALQLDMNHARINSRTNQKDEIHT